MISGSLLAYRPIYIWCRGKLGLSTPATILGAIKGISNTKPYGSNFGRIPTDASSLKKPQSTADRSVVSDDRKSTYELTITAREPAWTTSKNLCQELLADMPDARFSFDHGISRDEVARLPSTTS